MHTPPDSLRCTVHVLMGPPGAGKSYFARQLALQYSNITLISSDEVRYKLYEDSAIEGDLRVVFDEVYIQLQAALATSTVVIYEATNVDPAHRSRLTQKLRNWGASCLIGHCFLTPLHICLFRNNQRSRVLPNDKLTNLFEQWRDHLPRLEEGFDELKWYS